MFNDILIPHWPQESSQLAAVALAYPRIAQHKWVASQFMKWNLLMGKQLM